jgi:thioredoxin-dependent peroxiredoxin
MVFDEEAAVRSGAQVPDFEARLQDGSTVRLSALLQDGPVVLFFYPRAFTPGCTTQACHFRDLGAEFAQVGAKRIGVSRDDAETQARFGEAHGLDFPLISDPTGAVAATFGARRFGPVPFKRRTFVIGRDRTILGIISSETSMERHADEALALLRSEVAA